MGIKRLFLLLPISLLCAALLEASGPVMTGGSSPANEITMDNVDSGGSAHNNGITCLIQAIAEPGGITGLSGTGGYFLQAGYLGQDLVAPQFISLNASINPQTGTLNLTWSAPGDDMNAGQLPPNTRFFIATTTVLTDAQNGAYWNSKKNNNTCEIVITTASVNAGDSCAWPITGLVEGTTYYFRIWTLDQACNWSDISTGATVYFLWAPGPITNLNAFQGVYGKSIRLTWSAPGDNGYTGTLLTGSQYAIQRSSWTGVTYSTYSVDTVHLSTANVNPGDYQTCNLTALQQGVTYYVRMWTADEKVNWSSMSNSTAAWATWVILSVTIPAPTYYYFGKYNTASSTDTATPFIVQNNGNVVEDYSLSCVNSNNWLIGPSPGQNIFQLQAAFNTLRPSPLSVYNSESNNLSNSPVLCSNTAFTISGSTQPGAGIDPFSNNGRGLWFLLSTPLATGTTAQQFMTFTVTGSESFP